MWKILNGNKKGFLLTEVLIGAALITIVMGGLMAAAFYSLKLSAYNEQSISAAGLAQESLEALRAFRDGTDWNSSLGALAAGDPYHMEKSGSAWVIASGQETVGNFTREIVFENVSRDPFSGTIEQVYNPANDDPDTRKAVVAVFWELGSKRIQLTSYFTNWK